MDARGKFGKHEISFLSLLQTLQMHPQLDRYTHCYRGVLACTHGTLVRT